MKRKDILNVLFWILLIIVVILIIWRIVGNSPTDFSIIVTALFMVLLKMWAVSDELKDFKHEVKFSFYKVKKDMSNIKNKVEIVEDNLTKSSRTKNETKKNNNK